MNIKIYVYLDNLLYLGNYFITIYDRCNTKVYEGKINYSSIIKLPKDFYKFILKYNECSTSFAGYINNNLVIPVYYTYNKPLVIFNLTDKNYSGLKIEKGVINLWQSHTV